MAIGTYKINTKIKPVFLVKNGKVEDISHPSPPPAAGGPKGKGMENRLEKPDAPIISSEAKKSHTSKSKKLGHLHKMV